MTKKFIYQDEKSSKFWNIENNNKKFTITFGKIGTVGQTQIKEFESVEICLKKVERLINEKLKKGYKEDGYTVSGNDQNNEPKVRNKGINDYTIKVLKEKCNIVQIFEKVDEKKKKLIWQFDLENNTISIEFKSFFNDTQFVIIDRHGDFFVYDIEEKQKIFYCNLKSEIESLAALLSEDKKQLFLLLHSVSEDKLSVMEMDNFKIVKQIKIEIKTETTYWVDIFSYLWKNNKGNILIYYREEKKDHSWTHGYISVDLQNMETKKYEMSSARTGTINHTYPWLDIKNGIGVRGYYDLEIRKVNGKDVFLSKVAIFDLDTFKDIAVIPAREYTSEQLWIYDDLEKTNKLKEKDPKVLNEFVDKIALVWFTDNGYFWICYHGGVLRKISIDGLCLSTYIILHRINNSDSNLVKNAPFMDSRNFNIFDMKVVGETEIRLNAYPIYYRGILPDIDIFKAKEPIVIDLQEYNPNDTLVVSFNEKEKLSEISGNIIKVKSIEKKDSLLDALDQIEKLTRNIKAISHGDYLNFIIKDSNNKKLQEKKFFNLVSSYSEALPKIKNIIKNFISYSNADSMYIDDETTALAYAAEILALSDQEYIECYLEYLVVIDMEHDVINREKIIPKLLKKWKKTDTEYKFRAGLIFDYDLCDEYFLGELRKKKDFYQWFINKENMKNSAEWICQTINKKDALIEMLEDDELMGEEELLIFITFLKEKNN